jgi:hypothetical protein
LALVTALAGCEAPQLNLENPTPLDEYALEQAERQTGPKNLGQEEETESSEEQIAISEESKDAPDDDSNDVSNSDPSPPADLRIITDFRAGFVHGNKPAANQKYIVLHDTEGWSNPANVISWWDSNGNLVASHFIVGVDGTVYQCVPMDKIAHHAGYGDAGHNAAYGIAEDGRDDMAGSVWIGSWAPDYGMNAWSIGIEMVHVGGGGSYPKAQLDALDALIAYIDSYYGFQSRIIDHKAWRSGNSDTSPEFAEYLRNYQNSRRHNP